MALIKVQWIPLGNGEKYGPSEKIVLKVNENSLASVTRQLSKMKIIRHGNR